MESFKTTILEYLRNELKNDYIQININFIEQKQEDKKVFYTQEDKYKHMLEKNPQIEYMSKKLGLDFK